MEMIISSPETRALTHLLARYREPNSARGLFDLLITAVPFLVIWALIWAALDHGYWIGLLLVVPAAGFLVRLFMIQHDCGHGSFFPGRIAKRLGRPSDRCRDANSVQSLATKPCTPSRKFGQSRSEGGRRH
jgi:hypothetical protein